MVEYPILCRQQINRNHRSYCMFACEKKVIAKYKRRLVASATYSLNELNSNQSIHQNGRRGKAKCVNIIKYVRVFVQRIRATFPDTSARSLSGGGKCIPNRGGQIWAHKVCRRKRRDCNIADARERLRQIFAASHTMTASSECH